MWCSTMTCVGPAATLSASTAATRTAIAASSTGVRRRPASAKPSERGRDELGERRRGSGKAGRDQQSGHGGACGCAEGERLWRRGGEGKRAPPQRARRAGTRSRARRRDLAPTVRGSGRWGARRFTAARRRRRPPVPTARLRSARATACTRAATRRRLDPVGARAVARRHRFDERRAREMERAVVVGRDARREHALGDEAAVDRPPAGSPSKCGQMLPGSRPSPSASPSQRPVRVGDPAPRTSTASRPTSRHITTPASQASRRSGVDAVGAPDGEHVDRVAAADVDDVLGEQVVAQVAPSRAKSGRCDPRARSGGKAAWKRTMYGSASPDAVGTKQTAGRSTPVSPSTKSSSTASSPAPPNPPPPSATMFLRATGAVCAIPESWHASAGSGPVQRRGQAPIFQPSVGREVLVPGRRAP